jgi:hypothetical protein
MWLRKTLRVAVANASQLRPARQQLILLPLLKTRSRVGQRFAAKSVVGLMSTQSCALWSVRHSVVGEKFIWPRHASDSSTRGATPGQPGHWSGVTPLSRAIGPESLTRRCFWLHPFCHLARCPLVILRFLSLVQRKWKSGTHGR